MALSKQYIELRSGCVSSGPCRIITTDLKSPRPLEMDQKTALQDPPSDAASGSDIGHVLLAIDKEAERSYVRKLDCFLLPFLSLCYFFSAVDRVRLPTQ